jgi:D-glycero-D-manno-heptose 1,7-bisphosphate phosphatase
MGAKVHPPIVAADHPKSPRPAAAPRPYPECGKPGPRVALRPARYDSRVTGEQESAKWSGVRTVFLDRDGVLNRKAPEGEYVARWEDFHVLDGVVEALARLNRAGLRAIVVTNQRGIALGRYTLAEVEAMHAQFEQLLAAGGARMDAFYVCPHDRGECNCRKPLPGLFEQAAAWFPGISAATSVMIGDSLVDVAFGRGLGMRTILVEGAKENGAEENRAPDAAQAGALADLRCSSLLEAVGAVLGCR